MPWAGEDIRERYHAGTHPATTELAITAANRLREVFESRYR